MDSVTIVLLIASFLLVVMGIFMFVAGRRSQNENIRLTSISGIGQIILGIIGTVLAILYQFMNLDKNIIIIVFLGTAVVINVVQSLIKMKIKSKKK